MWRRDRTSAIWPSNNHSWFQRKCGERTLGIHQVKNDKPVFDRVLPRWQTMVGVQKKYIQFQRPDSSTNMYPVSFPGIVGHGSRKKTSPLCPWKSRSVGDIPIQTPSKQNKVYPKNILILHPSMKCNSQLKIPWLGLQDASSSGNLTWLWKMFIFCVFTHQTWWNSIAILNYQRVISMDSWNGAFPRQVIPHLPQLFPSHPLSR